jgi:hypothetical protein
LDNDPALKDQIFLWQTGPKSATRSLSYLPKVANRIAARFLPRKTELTKKCPAISDGAKGTFCNDRITAAHSSRQVI